MDRWPLAGAAMVVVGFVILVLLASLILTIIIFIIEAVAIVVGILLILGGIALIIGRRWAKRHFDWGLPPSSTQSSLALAHVPG